MPFILQDRRSPAWLGDLKEWQPGDHCYVEYQFLVILWKNSPRWTTADALFGYVLKRSVKLLVTFQFPKLKALLLAWQVFFIKYVMPYEDKKEAENGTI